MWLLLESLFHSVLGWRKVGDKWGKIGIDSEWDVSAECVCSMVGVPSLPLELGLSLLYTILLKNILEHSMTSICFHHVPSVSENFHCVISRHKCDFWSHSRIFSNLPSCSVVPSRMFCLVPACSGIFLVYSCSYLIFPCSLSNLIKTYLILSWPILSDCPYLILSDSKYHK